MNIAQPHHVIYIRLMGLRGQRIAKKDHKVDLIMLDLRADLLLSAKMSGKELMHVQIGDFLNQPSRRPCRVKLVFA